MTPIKEHIALLQAVAEGKTLQFASKSNPTEWKDANQDWHDGVKQGSISIGVAFYNWRIKPEPAVKWVNEHSDGSAIAYSSESKAIEASKYSHYERIAVKYQEVL